MELQDSGTDTAGKASRNAEFFRLYKPLHSKVEKYVLATTGNENDAREILAQTLLAAVQGFPGLRNRAAILGFLIGIASRVRMKYYREARKTSGLEEVTARNEQSAEEPSAGVDVHILSEALDQLSEKQKDAIVLFEISGFSIKEIAEIQNCGLSAVKSRLVRGREKLRQILTDKETNRR